MAGVTAADIEAARDQMRANRGYDSMTDDEKADFDQKFDTALESVKQENPDAFPSDDGDDDDGEPSDGMPEPGVELSGEGEDEKTDDDDQPYKAEDDDYEPAEYQSAEPEEQAEDVEEEEEYERGRSL